MADDGANVPRGTSGEMVPVGAVISAITGFGDPAAWPRCAACGGSFPMLIEWEDVAICNGCALLARGRVALAAEAARMMERMHKTFPAWLKRAGMSPREIEAQLGMIPEAITRVLPQGVLTTMIAGRIPETAFGLRGSAGVGKTFAIAAIVKEMARVRIGGEVSVLGRGALRPWMEWCPWPGMANGLRVAAAREGGVEEADRVVKRLVEVEMLVLDDLGTERWKTEDWIGSLLDLIVDGRHKNRRPILYTTHLLDWEIGDRYGTRFLSRLTGDNPLIEVEGKDMRRAT